MNSLRRNPDHLGVYLHVPFCVHKCDYCDFYSLPVGEAGLANSPLPERYMRGVEEELRRRSEGDFSRFSGVNTVYFGGGTASLLSPEQVGSLLDLIRRRFVLTESCEITLEGNPEHFTSAYLESVRAMGVTRVNAGIQSFRSSHLERQHRFFRPERYAHILEDLASSPLPAGGDLIYGFPGQTEEEFFGDLRRLMESCLDHLSLYGLTAEEGTRYGDRADRLRSEAPDEELQRSILGGLPEHLRERGYVLYEISNAARPGRFSRHNLRYWLYEPFLGLGPAAHGFDGMYRYGNPRDLRLWLENPAGAARELHDPRLELPLSLLRLLLPLPLSLFYEIPEGDLRYKEAFFRRAGELFREWDRRGYGSLFRKGAEGEGEIYLEGSAGRESEEEYFRWNRDGFLFLDDRIEEMTEALLELPPPEGGLPGK